MIYCINKTAGVLTIGANPLNKGIGGDANYLIESPEQLLRYAQKGNRVNRPFGTHINRGEKLNIPAGEYTIEMAYLDFQAKDYFKDWKDYNLKVDYYKNKSYDNDLGSNIVGGTFSKEEIAYLEAELKAGRFGGVLSTM